MKELFLITKAAREIAITVFTPEISNHKILLINSATGVKQQLYFSFAQDLAARGYTVITYDYSGVGKSKSENLQGYQTSMRIWGTEDYKSVTDYIQLNYPDYTRFCLGHSVGALILGMNADSQIFKRFIFVATQDAYFRHLKFNIALLGFFGFGMMMPIITKLMGFFPAHWFGLGEALPAGVGFDWRTLIIHPGSTSQLLAKNTEDHSKSLTQDTVLIYAEDDDWVTMKAWKVL